VRQANLKVSEREARRAMCYVHVIKVMGEKTGRVVTYQVITYADSA